MASFEQQMKRLEEIVAKLEDGDTSLEDSIKLFEEGTKLADQCRANLEEAEGKIEILMRQKSGKMKATALDLEKD